MKAMLREQMTLARESSPYFLWFAVMLVAVYFPRSDISFGLSTLAYLFFVYLESKERPFWGRIRAGVLATAAAASLFIPGWQRDVIYLGLNFLLALDVYIELKGRSQIERLARSMSSPVWMHWMIVVIFLKR
jgi:hypothetical protein